MRSIMLGAALLCAATATAQGQTGRILGTITADGPFIDFVFVRGFDSTGDLIDSDIADDATGEYVLEGFSTGTHFVVTESGFFDELYDDIPCPEGCDPLTGTPVAVVNGMDTVGIDLHLTLGGRIVGTVTEEVSGTPEFFTLVETFDESGVRRQLDFTDSAGEYILGGLVTGTYFVRTDGDLFDELHDSIPCPVDCDPLTGTPISVTEGFDTQIDFELALGGRIFGTLTNELDGVPLNFELAEVYDETGTRIELNFTNGDGEYVLGGLESGTYTVGTESFGDFVNELWDDIPCDADCSDGDVTLGDPITVTFNSDTVGVDFALLPTAIFSDGFESGDTSAWSFTMQ